MCVILAQNIYSFVKYNTFFQITRMKVISCKTGNLVILINLVFLYLKIIFFFFLNSVITEKDDY